MISTKAISAPHGEESRQHIANYRRTLAEQHRVTGSLNERVLRKAFADLLERTGRSHDLVFTNEWEGRGPRGNNIAVDGALVPSILRKPFGYWEAKDSKDDLDREIALKIANGYPDDNIIYEDTRVAVLRQDGREALRAALDDDIALLELLQRFYAYERPELTEFKAASAKFRADLPQVLEALRMAIAEAETRSSDFARAVADFLAHAKQAINPSVTAEDVREMLIQHILTEEIFASVFDNAQYHRENNVARRLGELEAKFFTGELRYATVELLKPYYGAIKHAASGLADRREKQTFLKNLYEDFYKVYNPAAADRLGVVYTPGEIVRFMIRGAEWLTEKHFGKTLADEGVEILDPATGTGTFVVELLEHMEGAGRERLRAKYANELHANEVAILPYYVANLNIEATYANIVGQYAEFPGLVFVDTLDNTAGLGVYQGHQGDLLGGFADENLERVKRQNDRDITVIIGNPPYFANQRNENQNNKSREYARIDKRISDTYIKLSTAKKTKRYDMYSRFFRWCSDRFRGKDGVLALVTNSNFIDAREADGFRKSVMREFSEVWTVNLKGNARTSGERRRREGGNVFEDKIRVGVAICLLVKKAESKGCRIYYTEVDDYTKEGEKRAFLDQLELGTIEFDLLGPNDENGDWLSRPKSCDWSGYLPVATEATKLAATPDQEHAIFKLYSLGVVTARDEWVYGNSDQELNQRLQWFVERYEAERLRLLAVDKRKRRDSISETAIKLTRAVKNDLVRGLSYIHDASRNRPSLYRPFVRRRLHYWARLNEMQYQTHRIFPNAEPHYSILLSGHPAAKPFQILATSAVPSYDALEKTQCLSRYRYIKSGEQVDNITDWALRQFRTRYGDPSIGKDDIFAYCYAALHDPLFRETHAADLRREFPRVPLHDDFATWVAWGRTLLDLHIGYEKAKPWPVKRVDAPGKAKAVPKLKSTPATGTVVVDSDTQLTGIPPHAWDYRLGNRSAIDWVLDQHKEKTPRDPTVRARFNTYRFADHKESMIELLARVVRVSVETNAITEAMRALPRD